MAYERYTRPAGRAATDPRKAGLRRSARGETQTIGGRKCRAGSQFGRAVAEQLAGSPAHAVHGERRPVTTAVAKWP